MSGYFLVARDKDNNDCSIISLVEDWYLKNGNKNQSRKNKLEYIDLVSMQFDSQQSMVNRMYKNGYIDSLSVDIFIAHKNKQDISYLMPIYNNGNKHDVERLREIATCFSIGNIEKAKNKVIRIYDQLIKKAYYDKDYCDSLSDTNVSKKVIEQLEDVDSYEKVPYNIKFNNSWAFSSYSFARSAIESFQMYDRRSLNVNNNLAFRKSVDSQLFEKLNRNYIDGQINLFSNDVLRAVDNVTDNNIDDYDMFTDMVDDHSDEYDAVQRQVEEDDWAIPDEEYERRK